MEIIYTNICKGRGSGTHFVGAAGQQSNRATEDACTTSGTWYMDPLHFLDMSTNAVGKQFHSPSVPRGGEDTEQRPPAQ